jgi:hypothetical protein
MYNLYDDCQTDRIVSSVFGIGLQSETLAVDTASPQVYLLFTTSHFRSLSFQRFGAWLRVFTKR